MEGGLTSPFTVALLACLVLTGATTVLVWRQRERAGASELAALLGAILLWAGAYAVGLVTYDEGTRQLLERVMWVGVTTVPVAWMAFALAYTGRRRWVTRRVIGGLLVVSVAVTALVFTNPRHELIWAANNIIVTNGVAVAKQSFGPLFWPVALYNYALVVSGAYLLLRLVFTTDLYTDQSVALVVGAIVPAVANVLSVLGMAPLPGLDMTPYAFSVSGVAFGYALVRYDLFEFVPATRMLGRDAVIDNMRDAVLIVDEQRRVVETNPVAEYAFDVDREAALGEPLAALLETEISLPAPGEAFEITTAKGNRTFEMTASPLSDWQGRGVGHVLVFRDVTERTLREQRLSVLNRVLRHNLRNELMVVNGHAELLADRLDTEESDHAERIRASATDLMSVGEKARALDRVVEQKADPANVDASAAVRSVVDDLQKEFPGVTVEVDLPEQLLLTCSHPGLFQIIVENLLENAVEHNDSDAPWLRVSLTGTDGSQPQAVLVVADNNREIPAQEIEALDAGTETSLRHSSSLGLWTVNWCVQRLGGTLTFGDSDHGGNRVEVCLPLNTVWAPRIEDAIGDRTGGVS